MTPRQLCNVVYAHLVRDGDQESRDKFDRELNAPAAGWATIEQRVLKLIEGGGNG